MTQSSHNLLPVSDDDMMMMMIIMIMMMSWLCYLCWQRWSGYYDGGDDSFVVMSWCYDATMMLSWWCCFLMMMMMMVMYVCFEQDKNKTKINSNSSSPARRARSPGSPGSPGTPGSLGLGLTGQPSSPVDRLTYKQPEFDAHNTMTPADARVALIKLKEQR